MSEAAILSLQRLTLHRGARRLIVDFSLDLAARELVALRGPSGCGKTSLLRAVGGLIPLEIGRLWLEGREPAAVGWPRYRRSVVLVGQETAMLDSSVVQNLRRPFTYKSAPDSFPAERARALIARVGLEAECLEMPARDLSLGERQRVALVRALLLEPRVLLLDEPTSALDRKRIEMIEALVEEEVQRCASTALIVTHDEAQAARWCGRQVVLGC